MFHVEQSVRMPDFMQRRRWLGSGNEYLGAAGNQAVKHAALMDPIQLRCQIIQRDHRPFARTARKLLRLRQQRGQRGEFGLTA